jgi:hypothetical protein
METAPDWAQPSQHSNTFTLSSAVDLYFLVYLGGNFEVEDSGKRGVFGVSNGWRENIEVVTGMISDDSGEACCRA